MSGSMSGMWKRGTVWIMRHRQTKGPDTDRPDLNNRATSRLYLLYASKANLRGRRDGAMLGLLLGCELRRSEVVGLRLDQLQSREGHWVIVDLVGKGRQLRTGQIGRAHV